jgi:hypothetical protein
LGFLKIIEWLVVIELRKFIVKACYLRRGSCWILSRLPKNDQVNPVRNSSGALNPALRGGTPYGAEPGIILKSDPAAEQRGIISNGVKIITPIMLLP